MMAALPSHWNHLCPPSLKERLAVSIDGLALLGTNDIRGHPPTRNTVHIREGVIIQQVHQAMKGVGFPLVGSRRKEQYIGRGFR